MRSSEPSRAGQRILVTGATGFLGGAVARTLHRAGAEVTWHGRSLAVRDRLAEEGFSATLVPLEDGPAVHSLVHEVRPDAIVHCAAKSAPFGPRAAFFSANVRGTQHLLDAAATAGVQRFVHISSPSIYCAGRALHQVTEDEPLPAAAINHYAATKRIAEDRVQSAHAAGLPTVTLRPRAIFGPGDNALFPRLLTALQQRALPVIGDGKNRIDLTYIDDAVEGVARALDAEPRCFGKAYNLTSGDPVVLWELIGDLCRRLQLPPPRRRVSRRTARAAAFAAESWHRLTRRPGEPRLTRYSVDSLSLDATLSIEAARRDLGYKPQVCAEEGVERFVRSLVGAKP